jgi:hypothetical protein
MRPAAVIVLLVMACSVLGCSYLNTGPALAKQVAEIAGDGAKAILQSYQPERMSADIRGTVDDPRYRCKMFVGSGVYVDVLLTLEGADLTFTLDSSGTGVPVPLDARTELLTLIGNDQLSEADRSAAIAEALARWLAPVPDSSPPQLE